MREFVTFIFPPLANIGMLEDDLLAGEGSVVIDSEEGMIGCGICFDSIYEKVIYDSARNGAEIIVIATNDSWFSDSAALDMHNSQSRLRAIESGKYVVRAANTGISSIIDPMGNVNQELGALERGYIVGEVSMKEGNTIYTHIGNLFVYCCMALVALIMLLHIFELRRTKIIKKT
jgi:apolipoprotein N-acyltransferase